jgi:hypothetical protein
MTAHACGFIIHVGFTHSGGLAIPVFYVGAGIGSRFRIAARTVRLLGHRQPGCPEITDAQLATCSQALT